MSLIKSYLKSYLTSLYRVARSLKWIITKKEQPKITIVVPYFNDDLNFFKFCLLSIKFQFYRNLEILIIDDCSKPEKVQEISKVIPKHARIISHEKNKGLSAARNTGLNHANGSYILFLDADDMLHAFILYNWIADIAFRSKPPQVIGSYGRNTALYPYQSDSMKFLKGLLYTKNRATLSFVNVAGYLPFNIHACLLDKSMLLENNFFFDETMLDGAEDWDFWYKIMRDGFLFSDSGAYAGIYRQRKKSMSRSKALLHFDESYQLIEKAFARDEDSKVFTEPWFRYQELNLKISRCIRELTVNFLQTNTVEKSLWDFVDSKYQHYVTNYLDADRYIIEGISKFHCSKKTADSTDLNLIKNIKEKIMKSA